LGSCQIGELSKPATVLIEKISDAIGGIFRPHQIRRVAQAEAQADKIRAVSQIEITELQQRALSRFFIEEANKQHNIEAIAEKALPGLDDNAKPQDIEDDWIANFFDKCRLISDKEMQALWSKILAGEANSPGQFSKRTVNLMSSLDKVDAEHFKKLCSFGWRISELVPLIYDHTDRMYQEDGQYFDALKHLAEIGLASFEPLAEYSYLETKLPQTFVVSFYGKPFEVAFPKPENNILPLGQVLLSKAGQQLAPICGSAPHPGFQDYVLARWRAMGLPVMESS
jgi:hypothetical protein